MPMSIAEGEITVSKLRRDKIRESGFTSISYDDTFGVFAPTPLDKQVAR